MAKIFYIEPVGKSSPDLFTTMTPTFIEQGHQVVDRVEDADVAMYDAFSGLAEYDFELLTKVMEGKMPIVVFDETDFGGMSKEVWDKGVWEILAAHQKLVYFMRKMSKDIQYPSYVFPYEKIIQNDFPITTKDELCSRPYDFCFAGNKSPQRVNTVKGFAKAGFSGMVYWTTDNEKLLHDEWVKFHRQAKLFLTADGGGFSDERPYQLFTIAPMLRQKNNHLQAHPFKEFVNCLEVSEQPTEEEIKGIKAVLSDSDYLFEIYTEGIAHMREYYSAEARSKYILSILKQEGFV